VALKATGARHLGSSNLLPGAFPERGRAKEEMCIAIPAEVVELKENNVGVVDYGDLRQEVQLDLVDVKVGDFVLVHVGFAIQKLSREEALETREIFRQVYATLEE
jgi:hydrogenase expression/formation protein HypC